ncbi:MAG: hypothetical protein AAGA37_19465 [Actinomycetota bacterium]
MPSGTLSTDLCVARRRTLPARHEVTASAQKAAKRSQTIAGHSDDLRIAALSLRSEPPMDTDERLLADDGSQPLSVGVRSQKHRVLRFHQWITTDDGQRNDPMSVDAAASAPVRVS